MKVLVASPVYDKIKYCIKEFIESILTFDYPDYDILLIDNSRDKEFLNFLRNEFKNDKIRIIYDDTNEEKNLFRLISSRNKILDYAIHNNYDYLFMLDSDVIAPKETIKQLIGHNKDIVSGIYYNNFYVSGKLLWLPVNWRFFTEEEYEEIKRRGLFRNIINRFDLKLKRFTTEEEIKEGKLIEVAVPSAGCMMLSKKAFENAVYGSSKEYHGDDIFFIAKAREKGINSYTDAKILCKHLISAEKYEKDENGNLIHPLGK